MLGAAAGHKTQEAGPPSNDTLKYVNTKVQPGLRSMCRQALVAFCGKICRIKLQSGVTSAQNNENHIPVESSITK